MVIDRNSWHARWYLLSRRAWRRFCDVPDWRPEPDFTRTDLCTYIRFSVLAIPVIVAAHLLCIATLVFGAMYLIDYYGIGVVGRGFVGALAMLAVHASLIGVAILVCWFVWAKVTPAAGSAAHVIGQYVKDRSSGICRFITIN